MKIPKSIILLTCTIIILSTYSLTKMLPGILNTPKFSDNTMIRIMVLIVPMMELIMLISGVLMLMNFKLGRWIYLCAYVVVFIKYIKLFVDIFGSLIGHNRMLFDVILMLGGYLVLRGFVLLLLFMLPSIKNYLKTTNIEP